MKKKLPKKLYVKVEEDTNADVSYFTADDSAAGMVAVGEKIKIGIYELVETVTVDGVARINGKPI